MSVNRIQFTGTTAEVAEAMSILPVWQLPAGERCFPPKDLPDAKQGKPWDCTEYVQDCHHSFDVVLPGPNFEFVPCA